MRSSDRSASARLSTHMRRLAGLLAVPGALALAVGGAIAASPGAEADLAAGNGKVVKYEGKWKGPNFSENKQGAARWSGSVTGKGKNREVNALVAYDDEGRCPDASTPEATRAEGSVRHRGKNFLPSFGSSEGYNDNGAYVAGEDPGAGSYRLLVSREKKKGKSFQRVTMQGEDPGCSKPNGFYGIKGRFTGPMKGTSLGKRFNGEIRANDDPDLNNPDYVLELSTRRVR